MSWCIEEIFFLIAVATIPIGCIGTIVYQTAHINDGFSWVCEQQAIKIKTVGGCNEDGICGVVFDDHRSAQLLMPIVGQQIQICRFINKSNVYKQIVFNKVK